MAPSLVLTYFDFPGAAEPIRWALEQGGLEWTDNRLTREEFGEIKPTLPNGQVPVLEVDGFQLPQSMSILRYVGRLGGLYPNDDFEAAKCDAIMDCAMDLYTALRPSFLEKDQDKKMEMRADLMADYIPKWLANVEKQLSSTPGTYFADKLSVADIIIVIRLRIMELGVIDGVPSSVFEPYPGLSALYESVIAEPKIAEFINKHPRFTEKKNKK